MPNIINHSSITVDSLQRKIDHLEEKFSKINEEHTMLLVQLKDLKKTLHLTDVKTSMFTDQLAFQIFCFSLFLVAIGWFSWSTYLNPMKKKLKKFEKTTIPQTIIKFNNTLNEELVKVNALQEKTLKSAGNARSWNYRSMMIHSAMVPNAKYNVLTYGLAQIMNDIFNLKKTNYVGFDYIPTLEYIYETMKEDDFEYDKMTNYLIEKLNKALIKLMAVDNQEISELAFSIKGLLSSKTTSNITPTTAVEAEVSNSQ